MKMLARSLGTLSILPILACSSKSAADSKDGGTKRDAALSDKNASDAARGNDLANAPDRQTDASTAYLTDPDLGLIGRIEIQGRNLYWNSSGRRLVKGSLDDLTTKVLFEASGKYTSSMPIMDFAVDSTYAYVAYAADNTEYEKRGVYRVALDGSGAPFRLTSSPDLNEAHPESITVAGDDVFYHDANAIRQVKTTGGVARTLIEVPRSGSDLRLLVHQDYVYFTMESDLLAEDVYRVPVGASVPATADGGLPGRMDGGAPAAPEKVSTVRGGVSILLGRRVDQGFVYWATGNIVYRTDGRSPPKALFDARDPSREKETGIGDWLFPLDGVIYWGQGNPSSGWRTYKQPADETGRGTVLADMGFSDLTGDADYLYGASESVIWRLMP